MGPLPRMKYLMGVLKCNSTNNSWIQCGCSFPQAMSLFSLHTRRTILNRSCCICNVLIRIIKAVLRWNMFFMSRQTTGWCQCRLSCVSSKAVREIIDTPLRSRLGRNAIMSLTTSACIPSKIWRRILGLRWNGCRVNEFDERQQAGRGEITHTYLSKVNHLIYQNPVPA